MEQMKEGKILPWIVCSQDMNGPQGGADVPGLGPTNRRGESSGLRKRDSPLLLTHPPRKRRRRGQEGYIRKLRLSCVVSRIKFSAVPRVVPLASFQH